MKFAKALMVLFAWTVLSIPLQVAAGTDNTWVSNQSSKGITATITYVFVGHPEFTNREVPAGNIDHDEYDHFNCFAAQQYDNDPTPVWIEIWLDTSSSHQKMQVGCDASIVLYDIPNSDQVGVYNTVYGTINKPNGDWVVALTP